jgi:glucose/arabinose dehydrogenase/mono/diheme cytochrome c family protein
MFPLRCLVLVSLLVAPLFAQNGDRAGEVQAPPPASMIIPPAPALSAAEALKTFKLPPGFRIEAVAADPLIGDPISIQFGPDGRMWVLEMRGFMPDADGNNEREPVGVIAVLEDTDGDGRYDKRTVFMDGLVLPRAMSLVGDGVLVAEPPHLWFFRDTNGDGRADQKLEIAKDYGNVDNPEHNANGLMWAMDNWIYSANFNARFRYQGEGRFTREPTIMRGQWGISQDDGGRLFYNSNSDPLRVDLIASEFLRRNPNFSAAGTNVQVTPANLPVSPGRVTPGINRGYNTLDASGREYAVTSACGPVIYRGTLFPAGFRGDAFIAEPSGNLVKRIRLATQDGTVKGTNAYEGTEFLTSTDERFRPVNIFNGPDGALYVVDLYRGIIQHRIYLTSYLRKQADERGLAQPRALGRIWRIVPEGAPAADFRRVALAKASSVELVSRLTDANGWVRDTAQQLLVERRDSGAVAALVAMAKDASRPATARLQALWTLDGMGQLDVATVQRALTDSDERVAAAAIRLAGPRFAAADGGAELAQRVAAVRRTEPTVRLQLALTLPEAKTPAADKALIDLVAVAGRQPYVADAVVSGLAGREVSLVRALVGRPEAAENAADVLRFATSSVFKAGDAARIDEVLALLNEAATPAWVRREILAGIRHFIPRPEGRAFAGTRSGRGGAPGAGATPGAAPTGDGAAARGGAGRGGAGRGGMGRGGPMVLVGALPAEPKALVALAERKDDPEATTAAELLKQLKWPGKPGASNARPLTADEQVLFEKGKVQFATLCAACHQANGQGLAGLAPSLVYSRWVLGDPRVLSRIVLCGKAQENLIMPPWKGALNDEAIASVLTFIRRSWGQEADPVTVATVAEARADTAKRDEPWTDKDLDALVRALSTPPPAN